MTSVYNSLEQVQKDALANVRPPSNLGSLHEEECVVLSVVRLKWIKRNQDEFQFIKNHIKTFSTIKKHSITDYDL